jgi:hypothetical protein
VLTVIEGHAGVCEASASGLEVQREGQMVKVRSTRIGEACRGHHVAENGRFRAHNASMPYSWLTPVVTFRTQGETRNCEFIFNYCTSIHCGDSENKRIKELEQLTLGNKFDDETAAVQVPSVIFRY